MALSIIGTVIEGIASQLLGENTRATTFRTVAYYFGMALQIIGVLILTVPYFSLGAEKMNFIKAIAIGWVFVNLTTGWYGNGFEGVLGFIVSYAASFIYLIVTGILSALLSMSVLLIVSTVIAGLSVVAVGIGFKILGNNME
ncbi:MAG: hypothetical protein NC033_05255 [Clostridiales bacterium]|nr:hypothetical protein [Clostridiales bacterium]